MKKTFLTLMVVAGAIGFSTDARAAACGPIDTSAFTAVTTAISTVPLPDLGRSQNRQNARTIRSTVRSTQNTVNQGCNIMQGMTSGGGLVNLSSFTSAFSGQLGQITTILNQAKALQSQASQVTTAAQKAQLQSQVMQLVSQGKAMADQLLAQARQMASQISQAAQVNL